MRTLPKPAYKDGTWLLGLLFIALSGILFVWPAGAEQPVGDGLFFGLFSAHYLFCVVYGIVLLVTGFMRFRWRVSHGSIRYTLLWLVLFLISAYALNRELPVFQESTGWLCAYLVLSAAACIAYGVYEKLPVAARCLLLAVLGAAFVLFVYLAIYLLPVYLLGAMAFFVLGISLHTFVPLLFVVYLLVVFSRETITPAYRLSLAVGIGLPLLFTAGFVQRWHVTVKRLEVAQRVTFLRPEVRLPRWVAVGQNLPKDWITEKVLKAQLVYDTPQRNREFSLMPRNSFNEVRQHDPLVLIADFVSPAPLLEAKDRIKILEAFYDARHQAQERLWSGKDLKTVHVATQTRVYPGYRLAYTEKTLTIRNTAYQRPWLDQQEAIYTFYLPEGAAVTSLSLWINDREEPGYLTTRSKADSAYRTVVGVESRDPSVVHWQEGNTVSVRVFPCTPSENRRFKIGVTSPLRKENDELVYENIYFQGPDCSGAAEDAEVKFEPDAPGGTVPVAFSGQVTPPQTYHGDYRSDWSLRCKATPVAAGAFSFGGRSYACREATAAYEPFRPGAVYLDLNGAWSRDEAEAVWQSVKRYPVYAFTTELVRLDETNYRDVFNALRDRAFSLFPLHTIGEPGRALLVSKSDGPTPNLNDLKNSGFYDGTLAFLAQKQPLRVYHLGPHLSPYLKTLGEFRALHFDYGTPQALAALLKGGWFLQSPERDGLVSVGRSGMLIAATDAPATPTAPDHLLRLFAYNDILRKVGSDYAKPEALRADLVAAARQAYVVTPLSSLVVLETQKDYDRFGITASKDSLKNASVHSSGAVPEPHEWLLILTAVLVMAAFLVKSHFLK
jgi:XrtN system VIT domain protein